MAYETFERSSVRVEEPILAVAPDGRLFLNAAATRLFENAGVRAVRILWDKAKCGIALQGANKDDKNAYALAFSRGRSASVSGKAFFQHIGWSHDRRLTVPAKWNEQQKMLEAELPSRFVRMRRTEEVERAGKSAR